MCSSKAKAIIAGDDTGNHAVARINGRPVLQPAGNRVPSFNRRNSFPSLDKKHRHQDQDQVHSPPSPPEQHPPTSPESKSPRPPATKRSSDVNGLNSSAEKVVITTPRPVLEAKKSKRSAGGALAALPTLARSHYNSSVIVEAPGSIAAVRREQMALQQAQRKQRIAHYGRSMSANFEFKEAPIAETWSSAAEGKRCTFITPNSDPLYVAYHDEEWGVPVHDDRMLFELLVLSGAQVGSDWTSILKKRENFRNAFSGFDAETVANYTERQITSICAENGIELSRVRGVVDNSIRILQVKREMGSLESYVWGFVSHKPIQTQYKWSHKIPVKTSKSESISKDMVRRGFRFVGPTVIHSFMQAAGLTNDHLTTCPRHSLLSPAAAATPTPAPIHSSSPLHN